MKNRDLIKALLDFPLDATVYVGATDPISREVEWDGEVEDIGTAQPLNMSDGIRIEFNVTGLDNYIDQYVEDRTESES